MSPRRRRRRRRRRPDYGVPRTRSHRTSRRRRPTSGREYSFLLFCLFSFLWSAECPGPLTSPPTIIFVLRIARLKSTRIIARNHSPRLGGDNDSQVEEILIFEEMEEDSRRRSSSSSSSDDDEDSHGDLTIISPTIVSGNP